MTTPFDSAWVYADPDWLEGPTAMGMLRRQAGGARDLLSFSYDPTWLDRKQALSFDPDLSLVTGPQFPPARRAGFGIFLDSSPDRWGRLLMQRRENAQARREGRMARTLSEWDYLLGVQDESRVGALRFRPASGGDFIAPGGPLAVPPLVSLRELQAASLQFEEHLDDEQHPEYEHWLTQLYAPGSSLGGARPKASVRDEEGALCIAKFPSRQDLGDVGGWECVAHRLAAAAGIRVAPFRGLRLAGSPYTTFLAKRFDRTAKARRLAFVSAMTLTQRVDGEAGASYLELVELLQARGTDTKRDCLELFRRVLFSVLIHNTDDHLRNHGFMLGPQGITLSPAFDLNPNPDRTELSLAINEVETHCDAAIAMRASKDYGISQTEAERVLAEVRHAITGWRREAEALRIPQSEQDRMAAAFTG